MAARPGIDLRTIAIGPQLSPEYGRTLQEIEAAGIRIDAQIECLLSSDTDVGMAKTIGLATLSLADTLGAMRPDILVVTADRFEMLAPASVATALRIPIAHIEGGEVSEGAIDNAIRNALTKLSHIHFTSTEAARERVIGMGESAWRVHRAGAPSLDHIVRSRLLSREETEKQLGVTFAGPVGLACLHPVTLLRDTTAEADAFFEALEDLPGQLLFCYPNADCGSRALMERLRNKRLFVNLDPVLYWSLLRQVDVLIGNSSSGIMEAASFGIPAVDVGIRQRGRGRGRNVLNAAADVQEIRECIERALDPGFRESLAGMENPYGDGKAATRIADVLENVAIGEELLIKV